MRIAPRAPAYLLLKITINIAIIPKKTITPTTPLTAYTTEDVLPATNGD